MARTVGYFNQAFLPLTQTFIYQYLTNHRRYDPFVAGIKTANLGKFPFEDREQFFELPKWSPRFWLYGGLAKVNIWSLSQTYYGDVIRKRDPDILHAHFGPIGVNVLPHRTPDRPLVTSFYGHDVSQLVEQNDTVREKYTRLFEIGDLFLVEGPSMREKLLNLGCPERKIGLQRIAIDTDSIDPRYPTLEKPWQLLIVGRFVEKKGMPDAIEAFGRAFADTNAELRIVGGEREYTRSDLERIAADHNIEDSVTFTGHLDYEEYLSEVRASDILLAPSKTASSGDSEGGAPTVILEAQASGTPIVGSTHADIPYVVEENVSGKLVTPCAVDELTDALYWCRDNPDRLPEMGRAGRENMEQHHDVHGLVKQLEDRYDRLL